MFKKLSFWLSLILIALVGTLLFFTFRPHFDSMMSVFSSLETFRQFVMGFGIWAPLIYIGLQIAQVLLSFIPGNVVTLAGGAIFGVLPGFGLSVIGMILGSLLAFFLARSYGQKFVIKLIGQKQFERYNGLFTGSLSFSLIILFLLPVFPSDVLCFVAGLSRMPLWKYALLMLAGRLPNILLVVLIGSGAITLALWQWIIFGGLSVLVGVILFQYSGKFETRLQSKAIKRQTQALEV